jgi:hypothetical protein
MAITIDDLMRQLEELKEVHDLPGDTPVLIDCGSYLAEVAEVDLDASDQGVVIWVGDSVD